MSQELLDELNKENLCTHFILPLLRLNKNSFLTANFVNSYLTRDGKLIVVQIAEIELVPPSVYILHERYRKTFHTEKGWFLVYGIPSVFHSDVQLFMEGKFSLLSNLSKQTITRYTDLLWHQFVPESGRRLTDYRLLALEKHELLKEMWENVIFDEKDLQRGSTLSEELLSIPGASSYIDLESLAHL